MYETVNSISKHPFYVSGILICSTSFSAPKRQDDMAWRTVSLLPPQLRSFHLPAIDIENLEV